MTTAIVAVIWTAVVPVVIFAVYRQVRVHIDLRRSLRGMEAANSALADKLTAATDAVATFSSADIVPSHAVTGAAAPEDHGASTETIEKPHINEGEIALRPDWERKDELLDFLDKKSAVYRVDPMFHHIVVEDADIAESLKRGYACEDVTSDVTKTLSRRQGVLVVGCNDFRGMLVYNFADDLLYLVDAGTFDAKPLPNLTMAYCFKGLGRAIAYEKRVKLESMSQAIDAYKKCVITAKRDFAKRNRPGIVDTEAPELKDL